jgi:ATP-binding cassette subfamily B protein
MSASEFDFKNTISNNRLVGLWRMMTGFRLVYLGAVVGVGITALLRTGNYLLLRYFVDDVLGQEKFGRALPLIALSLRNYLYDHIQRLSFTYHDRTRTGELIQRATSDVDAVRRFFADQAIGVGRIVLLFVINFVALLNLNAQLALLSIVVVPLIVVISAFFFKKVSKAYEAFQEQEAKLSTTLQENRSKRPNFPRPCRRT